jgi:hypothetical protein
LDFLKAAGLDFAKTYATGISPVIVISYKGIDGMMASQTISIRMMYADKTALLPMGTTG